MGIVGAIGERSRGEAPVGGLAVLAALPAVVALVSVVGLRWLPASDYAVIEVRVRDLASLRPPVLGPYTRLGGNHPGPAMYEALALPYAASGAEPWGLLAGAALVNAASIAASVWLLGRRGRSGLAALGAVLVLACAWGIGPDHLRDPWNPRLVVFPFLLAVVATWSVALGERWALPVAVGVASFCVQSHVGYVGLVAVLVVWWVGGVWWHRAAGPWRAPLVVSLVLFAAMWAPPLAQQVFGTHGNLTMLAHEVGEGRPLGLRSAFDLAGPHLGAPPPWFRPAVGDLLDLRGRSGVPVPPWGLVIWVIGVAVAVRQRQREALLLAGLTASLWVAGVAALAHVTGVPAPYLYRWIRVLGLLLWLSALWPIGMVVAAAAAERWPEPVAALGRRGARLCVGAVLAVAALVSVDVGSHAPMADYRLRYQRLSPLTRRAVAAADRAAGPGSVVEVRGSGAVAYQGPAFVAALERAGHPVVVAGSMGSVWGQRRRPGQRRPQVVLVVTDARPGSLVAAVPPDAHLVGRVSLLPPDASRRLRHLEQRYGRSCRGAPTSGHCAELRDLQPNDRTISLWLAPAST